VSLRWATSRGPLGLAM